MSLAVVTEMADTVIGHLSKGYRQRVGLADALVANPPLLILDEPTAGLDPNQIREVRRLIRELGESHTILLSTHILSEVESTCDRAIVIARGRLVAEGSIDELRARRRADGAVVTVRGDRARAVSLLEALPGVRRVKARKGDDAELSRVTLTLAKGESNVGAVLEAAVGALCAAGLGVREAGPSRATLEDVFAELTRDEADAAAEQETEE